MNRAWVLLLLAAPFVFAAPVPKALKAKLPDKERILGEWSMPVSEHNGTPYSKADAWTFTEGKMVSKNGNSLSEWVIKLDPDAKPKRIDIGAYAGIYEFDGEKLKIAYKTGTTPPTELNSSDGAYYCEMVKAAK